MLSAVRWKCRSSPWVGPRATLGKRTSWRKGQLVESLLYDQVLRSGFFTGILLHSLLLFIYF